MAKLRLLKTGHGDLSEYRKVLEQHGETEFLGYTDLQAEAKVVALLEDGQPVRSVSAGKKAELVLDRTPFYAESGGQVADTGVLLGDGVELKVLDVQKIVPGLFVHRVEVVDGEIGLDSKVTGSVDAHRRLSIERSHSATHLVHAAKKHRLMTNIAFRGKRLYITDSLNGEILVADLPVAGKRMFSGFRP